MKAAATGHPCDRGFTLVELLVAMAIASIIMAAIYSVYTGLTKSYTTQNAAADVQQDMRAILDFMAEDIMMAGLVDPWVKYDDDVGISEAGSYILSFNADRNMNGAIDAGEKFEEVTYELDGKQLWQTSHLGKQLLIDNVMNRELDPKVPLFRYFKEDDTDTPTDNDLYNDSDDTPKDLIKGYGFEDPTDYLDADYRSDIRTVEICLIVEEPAGRDSVQRTYSTRVRCRNAGL